MGKPKHCVIKAPKDITADEAINLNIRVNRMAMTHKVKIIYIDLSNVGLMTSVGLGVLINLWKALKLRDVEVVLLAPSIHALSILKDSNLTKIFRIENSFS